MKRLLFVIFIGFMFSCENDYKETFYDNGKLKYKSFYADGKEDSIIAFNEDESLKWIKKIYTKDSLYLWDYNNGELTKDGIMYNDEAYGKWNFFNKNRLKIVREYMWIDNHSYFNQEWHFNKNGDTIKDKGNYFKIIHNDYFKTNNKEIIRFLFEKPISNVYKNEMILEYDIEFHNYKTDKIEKDSGKILGLNNEVIYEAFFEDEGFFKMKGFILEQYRFINDSTNEKLSRTRKLYFDKGIKVSGNDTE